MEKFIFELKNTDIKKKTDFLIGHEDVRSKLKKIADLNFSSTEIDSEKFNFLDINGTILLHGKPGTGKSSICYELGNYGKLKFGASFYLVNMSSMISEKLGQTSKKIIDFFYKIIEDSENYKTIILIEEIEAFLPDRKNTKDLEDMKRALTVFMHFLEKTNKNILVIATTNHTQNLDKAILRRFSFQYEIDCGENEFNKFLSSKKNPFNQNFTDKKSNEQISQILLQKNYTISDLKNIMKEIFISKNDITATDILLKIGGITYVN